MNRPRIIFLATLFAASCNKPESPNKFSDPELVKIYDLRDRRSPDSLKQYLEHENEKYNKEALLAFGSVQDTSAAEFISGYLHLSENELKSAAAFALGQTEDAGRKIMKDSQHGGTLADDDAYLHLGRFLIEAGEHPADSDNRSTIPWAYYRHGLNSKVGDTEALKVKRFLTFPDSIARLGAVHFFARSNALNNATSETQALIQRELISVSKNDRPEIKMAAVHALRKIKTDSAFSAIENALSDEDYRVRVNAVRALAAFPLERIRKILFNTVNDKHVNVGIAASEAIKSQDTKEFWAEIANLASTQKNWRIQADLYHAAMKGSDSKALVNEIKTLYIQSINPYQKAALLTALQESVESYEFIEQELFKADVPVIRSAAIGALVAINRRSDFPSSLKLRFLTIYSKAVATGDGAVIGTATGALRDSVLGYRAIINEFSFLKEAKEKLSRPRDNDARQSLDATIAYFEKRKNTQAENGFNHPINWDLVKRIPKDQLAIIKTSKGNITIRLLVEEAPGSVANFVSLAQQNYFDQKFFHRVVPNFVIQGGCYRGDGKGSEDYSIRSEFTPRKYTTGSVGMASGGKDTESTQWFITHSPTPHLDGRYTIFAEVEKGMEVVHQIEVGDQIVDVELPGFGPDKEP